MIRPLGDRVELIMIQATDKASIRKAVEQFGPAPGARVMMDMERAAAEAAVASGTYIVWRIPSSRNDCTRVAPNSRCFCGHIAREHSLKPRAFPCGFCTCRNFAFVPQRPEEVGEWWLPRRKGFDVRTWRAMCKCSHSHEDHDPNFHSCRMCGCSTFTSAFLCIACDRHWEEHETLVETEQERRAEGRKVGQEFMPLADTPDIQEIVFDPSRRGPQKPMYAPKMPKKPEKSVRLMQARKK